MFTVLALLTSLSALGIFIAGSLALIRNPSQRLNQYFFLLTSAVGCWIPANFFGSSVVNQTLTPLLVKLDFSFAILIGWAMLYFMAMLTVKSYRSIIVKSKPLFVGTLLANVIILGAILFDRVIEVSAGNELVIKETTLFPVYVGLFVLYIGAGFMNLFYAYAKSNRSEKKTLNLIFIGFFVAIVANILTNLVFPEIFSSRQLIQDLNSLGYLGMAVLVACIYVAISARRLFDIRLIITRSLAYIFSLTFLVGVYGLLTYSISQVYSEQTNSNEIAKNIFSTALLVLSALSYGPLKRFFDKNTNKLFYRDAYDTQNFLDQLNNVLVTTVDVRALLEQSIRVIEDNLKSEFTVFSIRETAYVKRRTVGSIKKEFPDDDMAVINSLTPHIRRKAIITDALGEDERELKNALKSNGVSILIRLVATVDYELEGVGCILLGAKKSGNVYNKQDIRILEIIGNELVIAVQNALRFEEIEKFNATLQDKIDDATKQLQKTNDKLQALDETKDEFISMASHQLRTPLTSVKGYLSMVLEGDTGEITEMQRKLLDQAYTSSQRMVYLIADLLNVSRLRTGKFLIEPIATNLADVAESEVHQLVETAKGRGLTLSYDKPASFPTLMLDETKIRQVMMNFIDNAIYYATPSGHVTVGLKETDKTIEFTVSDDGIGVPKSEQHHLFTKFYRARNAKKARPDGTGLGLFMAKKVIVAQGGAIIFKSEEGKGSTFGFTFDKSKLQPSVSPTQTSS